MKKINVFATVYGVDGSGNRFEAIPAGLHDVTDATQRQVRWETAKRSKLTTRPVRMRPPSAR